MTPFNPVIMIPSFNTGAPLLLKTVAAAASWEVDVLLVIDGSTDGSGEAVISDPDLSPRVQSLVKTANTGKGNALRQGAEWALAKGYTHALTMDADGQHPADCIPRFLEMARETPTAIVMGQPIFGEEAPFARVQGRKLTSFWTNVETLWCGLGDTLFGMRVYPLEPFLRAFDQTSFARGFDFDPEIAVRMAWGGCRPRQLAVPVRYLRPDEGGVSHFHYLRDNVKLTFLHFRLIPELLLFRIVPFLSALKKWKSE